MKISDRSSKSNKEKEIKKLKRSIINVIQSTLDGELGRLNERQENIIATTFQKKKIF